MSWPLKPLSELCLLTVDCVNKTAPVVDYPTPYKMIRTTNVKRGFIDVDTVRYVTEETFQSWTRRSQPRFGDVILTREAPVGEVGRCTFDDNQNIFLGQRLFQYRPDPELLDWNYLAYALQSPLVQSKLHGMSFGATVPHLKVGYAENLEIPCPSLDVQKSIGCILAAYDDLIEANSRRICLLEESARLLYQEWFINFRFPGYATAHKTPSELGDIPHGWKIVSLENVCSRVTDGAHKSPPTVENGRPMASVKDMRDFDIDVAKCRKISEKNYDELVKADCKVVKGDILVAKDGSYLKHIFECGESEEIVLLSSIAMLRPNTEILGCFLMYALKSPDVNFRMRQCVSGVAIPRIVLKDFRNFKILLPPLKIQQEWVDIAGPMVQLCRELVRQNDALKSSRDLLLPQLMSGAIQV